MAKLAPFPEMVFTFVMKYLLRAGLLVSPIIFLVSLSPVKADDQSSGGADADAVQEHVYVTATRSRKQDLEVAAAVTGIDESQLLEQGPDVIAEMLRAQPGTFFQQTTPGQGVAIIRGLKGSQVLHMVDGMRLNNALFRNAPNQYIGLVDAFATQRLEVVRGAQGSLYGADAMGGVMHMMTHEPLYSGEEWEQQGRVYVSADSVDNGWVVNARTEGGKSGWSFAGGASYQDHSSRRSGRGEKLVPSGYSSKAADLKFIVSSSEHSTLMLSAQVMEQPSTPRYDELVPGFGQDNPSSQQFQFEPNRRSFVHARYRVSPQSGWIDQLEIHAARQIITDDRLSQEWQSPDIVTENNRSTLDGVTLQVNSSLASESRLVWGAEYYTDAVDSSRFVQVGESATTDEVRSRFPDRSSMDSAAVYLSGEWNGHDKLTLSTGLRYSWFDINLPADNNHDGLKLTPSDLTGDVHAVYSIKPTLKLVANIGRGFRPPNIFDLATLGPRPGNRFNIANPDLGSETVWSYDVGFKTETDNIEWEVFAFYLDYSDKITSVFTGQTTEDGRDIIRSENRNNVQIYGFESGLYWGLSDDLDVFLVLNHTRGQESNDTEPDIPADRIPPLNGKIGLSYQINDRWSIEPFVLFARDQHRLSPRDVRDPRINPLGTPGWGTINLLLDWHVSAMTQVGFRLENITDRDFREHASGIDAPGRNIGLWLSVNFK